MGEIAVGDKVTAVQDDMAIIGTVKAIDEFRVVIVEEYSAGVWGESAACKGTVHACLPADVTRWEVVE